MVTQLEIPAATFQYSHTIGRQEVRSGNGFFNPVAITHDANNLLYVLSRGTETPAFFPCKRVTVFTADEELVTEYGEKIPPEQADASTPNGAFMWPTSVALDSDGNTYVSDEWLNRISVYSPDAGWVRQWGVLGSADGEIDRPSGLAFNRDDNLYMVDSRNSRVQVFSRDGQFQFNWGRLGNGPGEFKMPWGIAIDQDDNVFVADWGNDRIQKFAADGTFLMQFGETGADDGQFRRPTSVAVDRDGDIYVTDYKNDRVQVFDASGSHIVNLEGQAGLSKWARERVYLDPTIVRARQRAHNLAEREGAFQGPIGVTVDNEGRVFVVESARHRVQVFLKQSALFAGYEL